MRVPLLSGITADETAEYKISFPTNLEAVAVNNKLAEAQFRITAGASSFATGPGTDRGGINWNNVMYRVMGTKLCSVSSSGTVTQLGDVGGSDRVTLDFRFSDLIIRSGTNLFYYNPTAGLRQVTDVNLGPVVDMMWIDDYTMTTDGKYVIVNNLADPMHILPLNYGAPEEDPTPITGLIKLYDEAYVMQTNRIEVFQNVGGLGFPFQPQIGASIPVGCVGPHAKCLFADTIAFVGSTRNEGLGVYTAGWGKADRISPRWVDDQLAAVADPSTIVLENRTYRAERRLLIHLPDKTLCFLANATRDLEQPAWCILQSGEGQPYRLRNAVECYGKWYVGDLNSSAIGILTDTVGPHFGQDSEWRFDVGAISNEGKGGILKSAELIGLLGRAPFGENPTMFMSITTDGENWSLERPLPMGRDGQRSQRLQWRPMFLFRTWFGMRFRGYNAAQPGFAELQVEIEPLSC